MSSKRSSSFRRAIANGRRTLQREILLDETGLGLYKRFVRYVAYEILPCETDRRWYFHQNRLCPPPVFIAVVTIIQVRLRGNSACFALVISILNVPPVPYHREGVIGFKGDSFIHSARSTETFRASAGTTERLNLVSCHWLLGRPDPWATAHLCTEHLLVALSFAPVAGWFRYSVFCPGTSELERR